MRAAVTLHQSHAQLRFSCRYKDPMFLSVFCRGSYSVYRVKVNDCVFLYLCIIYSYIYNKTRI